MGSTLYVGLATTSHDTGATATGIFDNVNFLAAAGAFTLAG